MFVYTGVRRGVFGRVSRQKRRAPLSPAAQGRTYIYTRTYTHTHYLSVDLHGRVHTNCPHNPDDPNGRYAYTYAQVFFTLSKQDLLFVPKLQNNITEGY